MVDSSLWVTPGGQRNDSNFVLEPFRCASSVLSSEAFSPLHRCVVPGLQLMFWGARAASWRAKRQLFACPSHRRRAAFASSRKQQ